MRPERAAEQPASASVEELAAILLDLAGDQDVRVIEALAAVLARQRRENHQQPPPGLSEATASWSFADAASAPDTAMRRAICQRVARRALRGSLVDPTRGATAVHRIDVSPAWSRDLLPIGMFGPFLFYRPARSRVQPSDWPTVSSSSREPVPVTVGDDVPQQPALAP
jgi:hypothetical protein